jgi:hypothetical protein
MIRSMEGFSFAKESDLNMEYYHIKLDVLLQSYITFLFPLRIGKYKYKSLPMGIKIFWFLMFFNTSCLSLSKIWNMVRQLFYLEDLLILKNISFKDHLLMLETVLARLSTAVIRVNISKSKLFAEQIEYLGYWIIRQGIQSISNKVYKNTILNIKAPKTRKEDRTLPFYWYSQLISRHVFLHKLASSQIPLTSLTSSKVKFEWYSSHQQAFEKRYANIERDREFLSATENCKEYKNILLGYSFIVFTDLKNSTFNGLKANISDRVLRTCWLLLLEEYGVTFEYLPGKKNLVADALSRLDIDSLKIQEEEVLTLLSGSENNSISNIKSTIPMHTALIFKEQAKVKEP